MDILRHGDHAEVLGPPALRDRAREEIARLQRRYA
jgi:predicted DNA-binding transcriptional regulator YafY